MKKGFIFPFLLLYFSSFLSAQNYELKSPDGALSMSISNGEEMTWSVSLKDKTVMQQNTLGMVINQTHFLGKNAKVINETKNSFQGIIKSVVPNKNAEIADNYNWLKLEFKGNYAVEFRAYNDGVAYRFSTSFDSESIVNSEEITLNFPDKTISYFPEEESFMSHYERLYKVKKLDSIADTDFCSLPVLMQVDNSINILVTEADLYDYSSLFFYGSNGNSLKGTLPKYVLEVKPRGDRKEKILKEADYISKTEGNRNFPWRVFVISDEDKELVESELVFQLSRPLAIENPEWIKPGKVAWDWYNANNIYGVDFEAGLNTETYKYYIDFASAYGLEYIILDEGWSKSTTNILETAPEMDVLELVKYGFEKNVGIILWTLWKPLDENLEEVLALYEKWGVKGIKVDFMQRADQKMVDYYERVVKKAANHRLLVDFHGAFKPAGMRRAYPNLLTYEGVKGNENNKWSADISPEHTVTLAFTRMVAGPMDFTPGAMANAQEKNFNISFQRPMGLGTRCHQVAMYVVFESPLQMLCDAPSAYLKEKETTEFIAKIPSVWDETKVLEAKVADYILIARRKGDTWYVGGMTDWTAREFEVDFSFLSKGEYEIEIMKDGANAHRFAEDYKKDISKINSNSTLKIKMATGGGWAAIITKSN